MFKLKVCRLLILSLLIFVPVSGNTLNAEDIVMLKKAGIKGEIIFTVLKRAAEKENISYNELKNILKELDKDFLIEGIAKIFFETGKGQRIFLGVDEIIELKKEGISEETILKMLDRNEEEVKKLAVATRLKKREDGKDILIYSTGSIDKTASDSCKLSKEEENAWQMLKNIRIYLNSHDPSQDFFNFK
ncbi:MAG: hypothetical protein SV062_05965 [Thermodesulfobacteriota bacterium]|nr:hypothetical protein [Thermodesulfobacteriota bacterium]